ncbi:hypothetical protein GTY23_02815 [Streptomyces sp. SID5998]|nr:hypothetical protein [Streptomyces sp. SID5998]
MSALVAEELERLHQLIAWSYPPGLSPESVAGEACVWCDAPREDTAVDLSTLGPLRACAPCYAGQLVWLVSWYDWNGHVDACTPCQQGRVCHVGRGRRVLHLLTTELARKQPPLCTGCQGPLRDDEPALPFVWTGQSSEHLGYGHTRCLLRRATSR